MLGPAEDALADADAPLPPAQRERVEVVHRNGAAAAEARQHAAGLLAAGVGPRRAAASSRSTWPRYTAELAGMFAAAAERAGLRLVVDCAAAAAAGLRRPRDVGEDRAQPAVQRVEVHVRRRRSRSGSRHVDGAAELERHRHRRRHRRRPSRRTCSSGSTASSARAPAPTRAPASAWRWSPSWPRCTAARSACAARRASAARSRSRLPFGDRAPAAGRSSAAGAVARSADAADRAAAGFLAEVERWLDRRRPAPARRPARPTAPRVLVVDDNADMRDYVRRLLAGRLPGRAGARDGAAALRRPRDARPTWSSPT